MDPDCIDNVVPVSVVVPAFNVERYICRCIDSILRQSLPPEEIIIVDDGSTDGTLALLTRCYGNDYRIKIYSIRNRGGNYGPGAARNTGRAFARSRFIHYVDADDWLLPDAYQHFKSVLVEHPDVECYAHSYACYQDVDDTAHEVQQFIRKGSGVYSNGSSALNVLLKNNTYSVTVWSHIVINDNRIPDQLLCMHEDDASTPTVFVACNKTVIAAEVIYAHHVDRQGSIMSSLKVSRSADGYLQGWRYFRAFSSLYKNNDSSCRGIKEIEKVFYRRYIKTAPANFFMLDKNLTASEKLRILIRIDIKVLGSVFVRLFPRLVFFVFLYKKYFH